MDIYVEMPYGESMMLSPDIKKEIIRQIKANSCKDPTPVIAYLKSELRELSSDKPIFRTVIGMRPWKLELPGELVRHAFPFGAFYSGILKFEAWLAYCACGTERVVCQKLMLISPGDTGKYLERYFTSEGLMNARNEHD